MRDVPLAQKETKKTPTNDIQPVGGHSSTQLMCKVVSALKIRNLIPIEEAILKLLLYHAIFDTKSKINKAEITLHIS